MLQQIERNNHPLGNEIGHIDDGEPAPPARCRQRCVEARHGGDLAEQLRVDWRAFGALRHEVLVVVALCERLYGEHKPQQIERIVFEAHLRRQHNVFLGFEMLVMRFIVAGYKCGGLCVVVSRRQARKKIKIYKNIFFEKKKIN